MEPHPQPNPTETKTTSQPDGAVYGIVARPGQEKAFWSRIGVAFKNRDGSINVKLDFFPRDPATRLQIRWISEDDT